MFKKKMKGTHKLFGLILTRTTVLFYLCRVYKVFVGFLIAFSKKIYCHIMFKKKNVLQKNYESLKEFSC